jgi:hypothetical protein
MSRPNHAGAPISPYSRRTESIGMVLSTVSILLALASAAAGLRADIRATVPKNSPSRSPEPRVHQDIVAPDAVAATVVVKVDAPAAGVLAEGHELLTADDHELPMIDAVTRGATRHSVVFAAAAVAAIATAAAVGASPALTEHAFTEAVFTSGGGIWEVASGHWEAPASAFGNVDWSQSEMV